MKTLFIFFTFISFTLSEYIKKIGKEKYIPLHETLSTSLSEYQDLLETFLGYREIPENIEDTNHTFFFTQEPTTAREHLLKYLSQRILQNVPDEERE